MSGEKMEKEKKRSTETQKHCVNIGTGASYFVIKTEKKPSHEWFSLLEGIY